MGISLWRVCRWCRWWWWWWWCWWRKNRRRMWCAVVFLVGPSSCQTFSRWQQSTEKQVDDNRGTSQQTQWWGPRVDLRRGWWRVAWSFQMTFNCCVVVCHGYVGGWGGGFVEGGVGEWCWVQVRLKPCQSEGPRGCGRVFRFDHIHTTPQFEVTHQLALETSLLVTQDWPKTSHRWGPQYDTSTTTVLQTTRPLSFLSS